MYFMKILAISEITKSERVYSSMADLKFWLRNRPFISAKVLRSWNLYRILPDGSKVSMRYGVRNMYDFVDYYRI